MAYYVYIIQSLADGTYHVGSTQNMDERLNCRNQGRSAYTKSKRPWKLVHSEAHKVRTTAVKRENMMKRQKSKKLIESLIKKSFSIST